MGAMAVFDARTQVASIAEPIGATDDAAAGADSAPRRHSRHRGSSSRLSFVAKVEKKGALSDSDLREFFREMLLIRRFEEKVEERFRAGELPGFLHVAIGQEAVAVGVCRALEDGDVIASTHREHGNMGANAVVGGGLPQITGMALAFQMRGEPRVAVAFFGDGATNIGTFHEALNLAQLWQVPAVFVLEDNKWAESTPESQHSPIRDLSKRAEAYGMKAIKVDGQDVEAVYKATRKALDHARSGKGPVLLHLDTYRLVGHYIGDPQIYRSKEDQRDAREHHDPITILGEDIAEMGGSMGVTQGMLDEFGPERVRNTPISEMALAGAAIGAAMQGMRPVAEIMYEDFLTLATEQIVNQAAKHRYMSGGQMTVPVVFRTQGGAGWSPGAQHAQQLESWFVHIPGLKVVFASTPEDVRGLLWSSIYDDNPVVFFEHRTLYGLKEEVPDELEPIEIGSARVHREGEDVTVVATGRLVHEALAAAKNAEDEGVSVEGVDPRTLQPPDEETLVESGKKTK